MKFGEGDRTTIFMIIVILVASIATLIAVINIIWGIVQKPISDLSTTVSELLERREVNYNFDIAGLVTESILEPVATNTPQPQAPAAPEPAPQPTIVPAVDTTLQYPYYIDEIINDVKDSVSSENITPQINSQISISRLNISSPVTLGNDPRSLMTRGFWIHPNSYTLFEKQIVLVCYRQFFAIDDPRSCVNLDRITVGDEITLSNFDTNTKYSVTGVNVYTKGDPEIYSASGDSNLLKIVTTTPLNNNSERLVITAKKS
jgi:LPXTG-site transpeptidase (sortase) family protein